MDAGRVLDRRDELANILGSTRHPVVIKLQHLAQLLLDRAAPAAEEYRCWQTPSPHPVVADYEELRKRCAQGLPSSTVNFERQQWVLGMPRHPFGRVPSGVGGAGFGGGGFSPLGMFENALMGDRVQCSRPSGSVNRALDLLELQEFLPPSAQQGSGGGSSSRTGSSKKSKKGKKKKH
jgi:hypothetical protein